MIDFSRASVKEILEESS